MERNRNSRVKDKDSPIKRLTILIPSETFKQIKTIAIRYDTTMTDWLLDLIEVKLKKENQG
jgi:hypothetical protein